MVAVNLDDLTKLGEGREAEIYAWDERTVLRLLRPLPDAAERLSREQLALAAAGAAGAPVPAVHERCDLDGRLGLRMEGGGGLDLLTLLGREPWRLVEVGALLGRLHAELHEVIAPSELPELRDELRRRIGSVDRLPPELAGFVLRRLDELPDGDRLRHGDFQPGNVLAGDRPLVIDWVGAARGDPAADVARTRLILRMGTPPPGAPLVVRRLDRLGRWLLLHRYLALYARHRELDAALADRWEPVEAAARMLEGIEGEDRTLIAIVDAHRRQSGRRR